MFTLSNLATSRTFRPTKDNQWEVNKAVQRGIVCGNILERFDSEDDKGCKSGIFFEYEGFEYFAKMQNGDVVSIRKLWEIEA
jgi:hypothetical protein